MWPSLLLLCATVVLSFTPALAAQDLPTEPKNNGKICVAVIENASTTSAFVERLTDRLAKSLKQNKLNAVRMDSETSANYPLQVTIENGDEIKDKECDYALLSQIRDPKQHPLEPPPPQISIGGRVPSIDASDPLGGSSGPVYRDNLQIAFALFRVGRYKPVLDTYVLERPSANVSDSFLLGMDHEANRVSHELKKH